MAKDSMEGIPSERYSISDELDIEEWPYGEDNEGVRIRLIHVPTGFWTEGLRFNKYYRSDLVDDLLARMDVLLEEYDGYRIDWECDFLLDKKGEL